MVRKQKNYISDTGLILRSYLSGDHDLVIHVLLKVHGKKSFFLHSGRKNRKKYPTLPEVFESGRFEFAEGSNDITPLSAYFPENSHRALREHLDNLLCAGTALECLDLLTNEASTDDAALLFQLTDDFLKSLEMIQEPHNRLRVLYFFLVELLTYSGYLDPEDFQSPSRNQMLRLLRCVEQSSGRKVKSLEQFEGLLNAALRTEARS
jgi:DNA repair protein RecO